MQFLNVRLVLLRTLILLVLLAMATPLSADPAPSEAQADEPAEAGAQAAEVDAEAENDDEDWVVAEDGRRYRVRQVPRVEGTYRLLDNGTRARFPGGALLEIERIEEKLFWVREYERIATQPVVAGRNPAKRERLKGEALEALLAEYDFGLDLADRLRFEPFDAGLPKAGQWRNAFAVADMNDDGHPDIVFGPSRKGRARPNVFLGDGAGSWRPWSEVRWPAAPYDYGAVAVGDLDGDSLLDLVLGIHLRGLLVLRNEGEGRFALWSEGVEVDHPGRGGDGGSFSSRSVAIRDWDQDGKPDVVALGEGPKGLRQRARKGASRMIDTSRGLVVYFNHGDGTWTGKLQEQGRRLNFGDDFAFLESGDGKAAEVVFASQQMGMQAILGTHGEDGFARQVVDGVRSHGLIDSTETMDLDADGRQDFVVSYRAQDRGQWFTGIDRFIREEGNTWRHEPLFAQPNHHGIQALRSGDINGDGKVDLLAADGDGQIRVFVGTDDGFYMEESPELPPYQRGCIGYDLRLADLDGDGTDEVVASFAGEKTGMPGLARLSNPGCEREGGIFAWKVLVGPSPKVADPEPGTEEAAD